MLVLLLREISNHKSCDIYHLAIYSASRKHYSDKHISEMMMVKIIDQSNVETRSYMIMMCIY